MSEINNTKELPGDTSPANLELTQSHQRMKPSLMAKYKYGTYNKSYFCGGSNDNLSLLLC